ncbi:5'-AMP-activated protein kinase subunit beta-1 [Culicoides brevitarsis]|uniref:5'-AMP-activated protein kinase subunit beta-1 n=1 Tax=Culicoides brevitarsis TaxID=469753 RepID=UPI00307BAB8D
MGNVNEKSMARERMKSGSQDLFPGSPLKESSAFTFDKRPLSQDSQDDDSSALSRSVPPGDPEFLTETRPRANTMSEGQPIPGSDNPPPTEEMEEEKITLPTVFKWDGGGKQVYISGTFSDWKAIPMVKSHGDFVTIIDLPEGEHEYKFYVDGEWKHDAKLKHVDNDAGTKNNMISVRRSDFEVFQALAKDSEDTGNHEQREYSQEIPQVKPWEKQSGPPVLPPHLLQVILNKDTPVSCEPTLLPEPNHVMLNHLYALSIKDGVMVLSATHRYRKKYVTTLLYKPI